MKNCGPKRYNGMTGSLVPGALGIQDFGGKVGIARYNDPFSTPVTHSPYLGEQDELASLAASAGNLGIPQSASQSATGKKNQFSGLLQTLLPALGVGAMAGLGGKAGVAMSPILALLMSGQQGGGLSSLMKIFGGGSAPTSAQTPKFNPNGK